MRWGKKKIQNIREKLDKITEDLIDLLAKRNELVLKIGKMKKQLGLPLIDSQRDKEVLKKAKLFAKKKGVSPKIVGEIIEILLKHAKEIQGNGK
jgi:chorismate mutase/prephenate dehydrogenase